MKKLYTGVLLCLEVLLAFILVGSVMRIIANGLWIQFIVVGALYVLVSLLRMCFKVIKLTPEEAYPYISNSNVLHSKFILLSCVVYIISAFSVLYTVDKPSDIALEEFVNEFNSLSNISGLDNNISIVTLHRLPVYIQLEFIDTIPFISNFNNLINDIELAIDGKSNVEAIYSDMQELINKGVTNTSLTFKVKVISLIIITYIVFLIVIWTEVFMYKIYVSVFEEVLDGNIDVQN